MFKKITLLAKFFTTPADIISQMIMFSFSDNKTILENRIPVALKLTELYIF